MDVSTQTTGDPDDRSDDRSDCRSDDTKSIFDIGETVDHIDFPIFEKSKEDVPPMIRNKSYKPFALTLLGKRKSGKSHMIKYIYKRTSHKFEVVVVMSQTAGSQQYDYMTNPKPIVITDFSTGALRNLWDKQEDSRTKYGYYPSVLLVLDDVTDSKLCYSDDLNRFYTQGRHRNVSIVLSVQNPTMINNSIKQNSTQVMIFLVSGKAREHVARHWLSGKYPRLKDGESYLAEVFKQPYRCVAIDDYTDEFQMICLPAK